ncbi:hypothetical protein Hte_008388 [Hypoxylon texense]
MANLDAWQVAIADDPLSKTFLDAIRLTRELGERFLWIDSLCIVQDDRDDLKEQIGRIGEVFEGFYCTIAATDAKGIHGSPDTDLSLFLSSPHYLRKACLWFKDEDASLPGTMQKVIIQEDRGSPDMPGKLRQRAWNSRGWIYQERQLSRRCIFFTQEVVGWRCSQYWETEQTGVPELRSRRPVFKASDNESRVGDYTYDTKYLLRSQWQTSVEDYSSTKLTYKSDKNEALQGMMKRLRSCYGVTFNFGVIDEGTKIDLCRQLLWMPKTQRGTSLKGDLDFACPTWS